MGKEHGSLVQVVLLERAEFIETLKDFDNHNLLPPLDFSSFERYCKERVCDEELAFVIAVHRFREIEDEEELQRKGNEILEKYVKPGGECQVNLPHQLQKELLRKAEKFDRTFFDEASLEIQQLLETDVWFGYIRTYTLRGRLSMARDMAFDWTRNPRMICSWQFFSFPHPINELDSRLHNFLGAFAAVLLVCLQHFAGISPVYIGTYLVYGFVARGLCGPRLDIQGWLVLFVLQPLVDGFKLGPVSLSSKFVAGPPRRFVQLVGGSMASTALLLNILRLSGICDINHWIPTVLYLVLSLVATIAFLFNRCAGCYMFKCLIHLGCIPQSTCEQCSMTINDNRSKAKVNSDIDVPPVLF